MSARSIDYPCPIKRPSPASSDLSLSPFNKWAMQEGQNAKELKPYVSTVMTATLSFDRRVLDEAIAAQFLQVTRLFTPH